jgi:hypothetical protein
MEYLEYFKRPHFPRLQRLGRARARSAGLLVLAATLAGAHLTASSADAKAPFPYDASPEIYKVISENDDFRVILATWPAGFKDNFHNHPVSFVSYFVTDCSRRIYFPDGKTTEGVFKKGQAVFTGAVESHSFENTGSAECQILIVDKKR